MSFPRTLGELRQSPFSEQRLLARRVKDELRDNLVCKLREGGSLFPGIVGYDDTVVPQIVNAILSRHNFILLGLRGQAKSRILRALTTLLDPQMPCIAGCEIHDNPYLPICRRCREEIAIKGDDTAIDWLTPDKRYVEKLATPDVTIADLIGDNHPIKAARGCHVRSSEYTVHYGLLPRENRGIVTINEFPDLAGKVQVRLFNIMQQRKVQNIDKRPGVSERLPISATENVISNAERRALAHQENVIVPRISDIYAALPAITGKLELEYEGEMKGADFVSRELIRTSIAKAYDGYFKNNDMQQIVQWFDLGGEVQLADSAGAGESLTLLRTIQGLMDKTVKVNVGPKDSAEKQVSAAEFILEGLHAHKRIGRSVERVFSAGEKQPQPQRKQEKPIQDDEMPFRPKRNFN